MFRNVGSRGEQKAASRSDWEEPGFTGCNVCTDSLTHTQAQRRTHTHTQTHTLTKGHAHKHKYTQTHTPGKKGSPLTFDCSPRHSSSPLFVFLPHLLSSSSSSALPSSPWPWFMSALQEQTQGPCANSASVFVFTVSFIIHEAVASEAEEH